LGALPVFWKAPDYGWDGKGQKQTQVDENSRKHYKATQPGVAFFLLKMNTDKNGSKGGGSENISQQDMKG